MSFNLVVFWMALAAIVGYWLGHYEGCQCGCLKKRKSGGAKP